LGFAPERRSLQAITSDLFSRARRREAEEGAGGAEGEEGMAADIVGFLGGVTKLQNVVQRCCGSLYFGVGKGIYSLGTIGICTCLNEHLHHFGGSTFCSIVHSGIFRIVYSIDIGTFGDEQLCDDDVSTSSSIEKRGYL
jgi:hypothetical protein